MRGVYAVGASGRGLLSGSSPHARGLRRVSSRGSVGRRIIPACAGFTAGPGFQLFVSQDHPRMRGVYSEPGLCDL